MSDKTLKYLAIALGALLVIYGLFKLVDIWTSKPVQPAGFNLKALQEKTVDKIVVKNSSGIYEIVKTEKGWKIGNKQVDEAQMTTLWDALKGAKTGELVSSKKSKHAVFEVDEEKGRTVSFYLSGRLKAKYIFGKQTADYSGTYIRKPGASQVYAVVGTFSEMFGRAKKDWYSKA